MIFTRTRQNNLISHSKPVEAKKLYHIRVVDCFPKVFEWVTFTKPFIHLRHAAYLPPILTYTEAAHDPESIRRK
jgi:hypothetical protein